MNYSGFDTSKWDKRTTQEHRKQMIEILACPTQGERLQKESEYGTRYSVLAELSYFDTIRMSIVDLMHNLFLGNYFLLCTF